MQRQWAFHMGQDVDTFWVSLVLEQNTNRRLLLSAPHGFFAHSSNFQNDVKVTFRNTRFKNFSEQFSGFSRNIFLKQNSRMRFLE